MNKLTSSFANPASTCQTKVSGGGGGRTPFSPSTQVAATPAVNIVHAPLQPCWLRTPAGGTRLLRCRVDDVVIPSFASSACCTSLRKCVLVSLTPTRQLLRPQLYSLYCPKLLRQNIQQLLLLMIYTTKEKCFPVLGISGSFCIDCQSFLPLLHQNPEAAGQTIKSRIW